MPATWPNSGPFDATVWEERMARPAAPSPTTHMTYTLRIKRASRLLRARLNLMEDPPGPLSPHRKRLLSHQANRLSRIVEALLIASLQPADRLPAA